MGMFSSGVGLQSGCARACMPPCDKASVAGQLVSNMFWLEEGGLHTWPEAGWLCEHHEHWPSGPHDCYRPNYW